MDDHYEELADECGDKAFLWFVVFLMLLISSSIGGCIGHDIGQSVGRDEIWKQAVEKDKAEIIETSGGTFYKWKS